jgi:hypothetical protein
MPNPISDNMIYKQFNRKKIEKFLPLFILLLAFGLQTGYLAELRDRFPNSLIDKPFCGVDAEAHIQRAIGLLDGSIPGDNPFYFQPLYPLYLAILRQLLGHSLLLPVFGQALLQVVGIAALYRLGRLTFSPLTGILAALGLATYNYYIFYLPCFDQALLTAPLFLLAVFLLIKYHPRQQPQYLLGAGLAFGAAALSRPTILAILPVVVIWFFWNDLIQKNKTSKIGSIKQFGHNVIFLILPVIIIMLPFTWYNYRVSGQFILLTSNFDINFFTGNNPEAQGFDSLAHIQSQPPVLYFLETIERVHKGETTFTAEALRYVWEQPIDALALTVRKTWLWFGETEQLLIEPFFPLAVWQTRTLALLPLKWQAMMATALLGILLVRGRCRSRTSLLWIIYFTFSLATIIFFIQFRFRLPAIPLVMLFAASLVAIAPRWSRQCPRRFGFVLALLLVLLPLVPGLSLFALLFAGLGLWSYLTQNRQVGYRRRSRTTILLTGAILLYVLLVNLWIRANALASDVSQTMDIYLGPPLVGTSILGQTFQMDCDGLNRIDVTLGTFNHNHDQPITFYLATDTSAQKILFSETFEGNSVRDYQKRSFSFQPVVDSAGRTFFFFIESPTSTPDNAITARGYSSTPIDYYPGGQALTGPPGQLEQLQADFTFKAYCDLTLWEKVQAVFNQPSMVHRQSQKGKT